MILRTASLFSQLLQEFPRDKFQALVKFHKADKGSKGFSTWEQFVAMLFCQMAQAKSLREVEGGLACCLGKLAHLGLKTAPPRSTLSYANAHRPPQFFEDLFYQTLDRVQAYAPKKKLRFKNKLMSLDSTRSACPSTTGPSTGGPRGRPRCIWSWTMTAIFPASP